MKKLMYLLAALLTVTVISCGDDDPVIPRDRDIEFSMFELFHISGATPTTSLQECDITIHRKTVTADYTIRIALDGNTVQTFTLKDLALTYDEDENRYTVRSASTNEPRISNFVSVIDCNDYIAEMSFLLDGTTQVSGTSNELFYNKGSATMSYDDGTSYTDNLCNFMVSLHPDANSTNLSISSLLHKKDVVSYNNIILEGLDMSVTTTGYHISKDQIETTNGQYSRYDPTTGAPTTAFGDSLFLRFENLQADISLAGNSMTGSWTMVRLKRVTDTIQKTPEVITQQQIIEVGRTPMTVHGDIY